jgi:putative copper resistance protein D
MSERFDAAPARSGPPATALLVIWVTVGASLAIALAAAGLLALQPPLPGRAGADPVTGLVSLLGDLVARLAGATTLGLLAAIVAFLPPREEGLPEGAGRLRRWLVRTAQVWFAASVLMTFANPSFVEGTSITDSLRPDAWWLFLTTTPSDLAWVASAVVALGIVAVGYAARQTSAFTIAWLAGALATVFVAVTGNVSVGLDHDWATDAMTIATLAGALLASGAIGLLFASAVGAGTPAGVRRYQRAAGPLLVVMAGGYAIAAWQQLAGVSVFATDFGLPVLAGFTVIVLLAGSWALRQFGGRADGRPDQPAIGSLTRDLVLLILGMTCLTAATHLPPPRFLSPQSIQVNYLGYEVDLPATIERLAGPGRPNLLWLVLSLTAIGLYVWGVARVRRRGGHWPVSRLLFWLAGWLLTVYLAVSGLWMYSTAVFSWHMLVHMTVNMMVPVLCVLGAPLSLVEAASREHVHGDLAGPRLLLDQLGSHRLVRLVLSPPLVWAVYVFSLFAVYFSPLFAWLMRYHWGHQLMLLHFMVAGYAFFALLVGPDRHPWPLPYLVKFALLVSVMPFHAIFAVGIMMATSILGEEFYRSIDIGWVGDLLAVQSTAGQITWFTGEIPAFIAVIVLAAQWFRSDSREAAAADQLADAGEGEDELAAYNDLLAELAERDRREGRAER